MTGGESTVGATGFPGSSGFPAEPWEVREVGLDLKQLAQTESVFALSNGHIGVRGNLDEGEPNGLAGTYLNSFFERHELRYAEMGYGYPDIGETVVNVTDGKVIRLLVNDEPFDLRYGHMLRHERVLDLRSGTLRRVVEWRSPAGQSVRVTSTRLVSFTQRAVLAIRYEVQALGQPVRVVVQSELVANEAVPQKSGDPREGSALEDPLISEEHTCAGDRVSLMHRTRLSGLRMVASADHVIEGNEDTSSHTFVAADWARTTIGGRLAVDERLMLTKFVSYGWSSVRSRAAVRDQADAALSAALHTDWDGLLAEQRAYLDDYWHGADVRLDGDPAVQQAVRFGMFQVLQAGARAEQRALPAKGLTGPGYDGHAFWDTEAFVLPVLTATLPHASADALRWRLSTMPAAQERARSLGLRGAAFPWRTIRGRECSAYWPAGTAALHLNADIAVAAGRQVDWTGDEEFERSCALPLLVETARLWMSIGYVGDDERFHIDGVTGPDEYSAVVDDNTYTNLMAARNLSLAARTSRRWPDAAARHDVDDREVESWLAAAAAIAVPRNAGGMPEQDRGSTLRQRWDFERTQREHAYPLLLNAPYFDIYRKQVAKQADLVLAMHWCGDAFSADDKASGFAYYEELTVRDSSLSACTQAVIAAEVGHLDLAHAYVREAALMDLRDLEHNTGDGLHIASLAGAWIGLVCGFGGLRDHGGQLSFAPRLPSTITAMSFTVRWQGCLIEIEISEGHARYSVEDGPDRRVELRHHGQPFTVGAGQPVELDIPELPPVGDPPSQPAGRKPLSAFADDEGGDEANENAKDEDVEDQSEEGQRSRR